MAMPKSVTKINKDGVQFISSVSKIEYTLNELTKAALRDTAKLIRNQAKAGVPVFTGTLKKNVGTWVRTDHAGPMKGTSYLQLGVYNKKTSEKKGFTPAYHAHLVEFGTVKTPPHPFLRPSVYDNINEIQRIQGQYLSAIEDENRALALIEEGEEISDD